MGNLVFDYSLRVGKKKMIEDSLIQYGAVGIFCVYLIYDKQVLMKKIVTVLEKLASRIEHCPQNTGKTTYL